jgi:hypothetical protein
MRSNSSADPLNQQLQVDGNEGNVLAGKFALGENSSINIRSTDYGAVSQAIQLAESANERVQQIATTAATGAGDLIAENAQRLLKIMVGGFGVVTVFILIANRNK